MTSRFLGDPTEPDDGDGPCQWCGGGLSPFADPDTACGGDRPSTVFWERVEDAFHVHGHGGHTRFEWLDDAP